MWPLKSPRMSYYLFWHHFKGRRSCAISFCTKCKKDTNKAVQCIPENDELKDILISDFLIHKIPDSELSITPQSRFPPYSPLLPPFGLSYTPVERQTIYSQAPSLNPNLILAAPPRKETKFHKKIKLYIFTFTPGAQKNSVRSKLYLSRHLCSVVS